MISHKKVIAGTMILPVLLAMSTVVFSKSNGYVPKSLDTTPSLSVGKWTASDLPYKTVERQIAKDYTDGKSMQDVLRQWQRLAAENPKDPVAQFAVAFAARGAYRVANPGGTLPYSLEETLATHDPGNVHEYTSLRFCMLEEADRPLPPNEAKIVGDKLLQYNPKDVLVRINLIYMLCNADHAQTALPYALNWVKTEPNNAKAHSSLALVYQDRWFETKNKQYGRMAVQEFQQFLKTASPTDGFRGLAQNSIKFLQKDIAKSG